MQLNEHEILRKMIRVTLNEELLKGVSDCEKWKNYYNKKSTIAHGYIIDIGEIFDKYIRDLKKIEKDIF